MAEQPSEMPEGVQIENGQYVFKDKDGISYEWDSVKQAWFPMWQDDLITQQQSAYGEWVPPSSTPGPSSKNPSISAPSATSWNPEEVYDPGEPAFPREGEGKKRKQGGSEKTEKEEKPSSVVYVSGLPLDITIQEVKEHFEKCGVIKVDFESGPQELPKIKLYKDGKDNLKGDGWVSYYRHESVPLAIQILDQSEIRPGHKISVSPANFEHQKGDGFKKRKVDKKMMKQKMMKLEKKLQWYDEGSGVKAKYSAVVILKHMFKPNEIEKDPGLIIDLKEDIREECEKLGEVSTVMVFDKTEDGVCSVKFKTEEAAQACIEMMNGRFFGGRKVEASIYDGKTKYTSSAGEEDKEKEEAERLERYSQWLEGNN